MPVSLSFPFIVIKSAGHCNNLELEPDNDVRLSLPKPYLDIAAVNSRRKHTSKLQGIEKKRCNRTNYTID